VYCIDQLPVEPFDVFVSGDGDDKCYVWRMFKEEVTEEKGEEEGKDDEEMKEEGAKQKFKYTI